MRYRAGKQGLEGYAWTGYSGVRWRVGKEERGACCGLDVYQVKRSCACKLQMRAGAG